MLRKPLSGPPKSPVSNTSARQGTPLESQPLSDTAARRGASTCRGPGEESTSETWLPVPAGHGLHLVMYVSAADNDYVGVTGTFLGTPLQGVWSTARLDFLVPPGGIEGQRELRPAAVQRRELRGRVHHGRGRLERSLLRCAHSHRRRRRGRAVVHGGRVRQLAEHQRRGQRGPAELRHRNHGQHTHHQQHGQRWELYHGGRRVHRHADGLGRSNRAWARSTWPTTSTCGTPEKLYQLARQRDLDVTQVMAFEALKADVGRRCRRPGRARWASRPRGAERGRLHPGGRRGTSAEQERRDGGPRHRRVGADGGRRELRGHDKPGSPCWTGSCLRKPCTARSGPRPRTWRSSRPRSSRVLQDNADKFPHNKDLADRRVKAVQDAGAFRAPTNTAQNRTYMYTLEELWPSWVGCTLPRVLAICAICAIWVLHAKPLNLHSPRFPCYMCYMCYISQGNPLSPGSLLYVLYVLYGSYKATEHPLSPGSLYMCEMCYIPTRKFVLYVLYRGHIAHIVHIARNPKRVDVQWVAL